MIAGKAAGARGKKTRTVRPSVRPSVHPPAISEADAPTAAPHPTPPPPAASAPPPPPLELLEVEISRPSAGALLGIGCEDADESDAGGAGGVGVVIAELAPTGLAAKAGVVYVGDRIVHVNGVSVHDASGATEQLRAAPERVLIDVLCTTDAQLALQPPHVMDTILSVRLHNAEKEYLVR